MPFEPEKITRDHILQAVTKIEKGVIALHESTGYDVLINGKPYPPKELMRYAHEIATGEYLWHPGGGHATNKYLEALGFEIVDKRIPINNKKEIKKDKVIWKLGCNWGRGAPSFYFLIKDQSVVIGNELAQYSIGDLVAIAEGHQIKAIAKVKTTPVPVTRNNDFKDSFKEFQIDYEDRISYSDAEWYELPKAEQFLYKLQQGICEIQNQEIRQKVIDLWTARGEISVPTNTKLMQSKNIILYGPPGTGKTYHCIDKSVEIITGKNNDHSQNKIAFDDLRKNGQIEFITFHQNYSYEDFMVGLKPDAEFEQLRFKPFKGVFYEIARRARENYQASKESRSIEKDFETTFGEIMKPVTEGKEVEIKMKSGISFWVYDLRPSTILFRKQTGSIIHTLSIDTLKELIDDTRKTPAGLEPYYTPLVTLIKSKKKENKGAAVEVLKNYVLIIDEINRANISRVFGELITLLEDDKRMGEQNELKISLPNGEKEFCLSPNLFLLGTMNTADKSIALVDIALRRRFEFIGFYPNYNVNGLSETNRTLLKHINNAIYGKKKSADFLIGHAYFLNSLPTDLILRKKIIPLLMEYFSGKNEIVQELFSGSGYSATYNTDNFDWEIETTFSS